MARRQGRKAPFATRTLCLPLVNYQGQIQLSPDARQGAALQSVHGEIRVSALAGCRSRYRAAQG